MKRLCVLIVSIMMVLGLGGSAFADTTYVLDGLFSWLYSPGTPIQNTSEPYYSSSPYYGFHTPIQGTMTQYTTPLLSGQIGEFTVNTFNFWDSSIPANIKQGTVYAPGSYTFNGEAFTVAPNLIGAKMLFDWNGNNNMDVLLQWDVSGTGMSLFPDTHLDGLLVHNDGPFGFASMDDDGDGIMGHPMWNGPFSGLDIILDFNVTAVPEPASLLLIGSGLVGLIGVVHRKNRK